MAIDFPNNPSSQSPTNEFSPTSSPLSTSNGVTYTWDGEKWVASSVVLSGEYVRLIGDNMTGNLTLGSDPANPVITLNAADGSGVFSGTIQAGDYTSSNGGVAINYAGNITTRNDTTNAKCFRILNGGTDESTNLKAFIDTNGSGTFNGGVRAYNKIAPDSSIQNAFVQVASSNTHGVQLNDGSSANIMLAWDGSAMFDGRVTSNEGYRVLSGDKGFQSYSDSTGPIFVVNNALGNSVKISLNGDGSSTFAGNITFQASGVAYYNNIGNSGDSLLVDVDPTSAGGPGADFRIQVKGVERARVDKNSSLLVGVAGSYTASSPAIKLNGADGSATFAGRVNCGGTSVNPVENDFGLAVSNKDSGTSATIYGNNMGDGTGRLLDLRSNNVDVCKVEANGSATFAGRCDIGTSSLNDNVALKLENNYDGAATLYVQNFNNSGDVFSGRRGDNVETSSIGADGSATFTGRVNANNAIIGDASQAADTTTLLNIRSSGPSNVFRADGKLYFGYNPATPSNSLAVIDGVTGDADFAGSVTADNVSFSIDNGATLDVKRVGNALVALKAAAASANDFTALKSAIATALADI